MISSLEPYPRMKDSGVPWLGDVPEHWEVRGLKWVAQLNPSKTEASTFLSSDSPVTFLPMERVGTNGKIDFGEPMEADKVWQGFTYFRKGDVIVAKITPCFENGKGACLDSMPTTVGFGSTEFHVLRAKGSITSQFLYKFTTVEEFRQLGADAMTGAAGQQRVPQSFIANYKIGLPLLHEQTAIVKFLDHYDRKIRLYIRAKQKMVKLLEEQKQAIIHHAVTGQVDVRTGKPFPAYKPSGVEWLGDIPKHWEVVPLSRVLKQRKEKNDPIKTTDILSLSLDMGVIPYAEKKAGGNKAKGDLSGYMLAYPGDIVVNSMNVVVGSVGLSKYYGAVSPAYYMLRPRQEDDLVEYFSAVFQDIGFQRSLFGLGNGIMFIESRSSGKLNTIRLRIPMVKLKKVVLPYPAYEEQSIIVEYLDEVTADIDTAITCTRREIKLLREYRTRLIADVVTGKLDVREAAARLPDETEEPEPLEAAHELIDADDPAENEDLPEALPEEVEA